MKDASEQSGCKLFSMRHRRSIFAAVVLPFIPAIAFYIILWHLSFDIPILDDYPALLEVLVRLRSTDGVLRKITYLIGYQHNEYKLWLDSSVAWFEFRLLGHVNFRCLCLIGDSFVLLTGFVLWVMFLPTCTDTVRRLILFIPVSLLLFQLSYAETLNWAMASLQNLPVIFFSMLSIVLLLRPTGRAFWAAAVCLVLAISSSGNGFLTVPIGATIMASKKRYPYLVYWIIVTITLSAGYAFHYNIVSSANPASEHALGAASHRSVIVSLSHFSLKYTLAFIGSIGTSHACLFLGALICIINCYLLFNGYFGRNEAVGYCVLFMLITAVGVAGIRSEFGLLQAISSRYKMYSTLMIIFCWFPIAEAVALRLPRKSATFIYLAAMVFGLTLFAREDLLGYSSLSGRRASTMKGMRMYEQSATDRTTRGPIFWEQGQGPLFERANPEARVILREAERLGIYLPPDLLSTETH